MSKSIESRADFLRSLSPSQRDWFALHEARLAQRMQCALARLAAGLSEAAALNNQPNGTEEINLAI